MSTLLVHPKTGTDVSVSPRGELSCPDAAVPLFAGVPCLFANDGVLPAWRELVESFRLSAIENERQLERSAARAPSMPLTQRRLTHVGDRSRALRATIETLFADELSVRQPSDIPEQLRRQAAARFMEGSGLLTRDWCGSESAEGENRTGFEQLMSVVPTNAKIDRLLVLGAGGMRLTHDLHAALRPRATWALDINPLPFAVAHRLLQGETITLYDFLKNPCAPDDAAIERVLVRRGAACPSGLHMLLADARMPPVRPRAFDAVLTPWYIDQVAQPLSDIVDKIAAILPSDGLWLNLGPLIYTNQTAFEMRLTYPELRALIEGRGFIIERSDSRRVPHLQSPENASGRVEEVHAFCARKM